MLHATTDVATCRRRRCYIAPPTLLHPVAAVATGGRRPCYKGLSAEVLAASGGRSCYKGPAALLQGGCRRCSHWRRRLLLALAGLATNGGQGLLQEDHGVAASSGGGRYRRVGAVATNSGRRRYKRLPTLPQRASALAARWLALAGGATSSGGATASGDGDGTASGGSLVGLMSNFTSCRLAASGGGRCAHGDDDRIFFVFFSCGASGQVDGGSTHVVEVGESVFGACR
jgi:hypothetical protein